MCHVMANMDEWPERLEEVPNHLLQVLADTWVEPEPVHEPPANGSTIMARGYGTGTVYSGFIPIEERVRRATNYVAKMPPSISGNGGHKALYDVTLTTLVGFAVPEADAWPILHAFNSRCQPPWSQTELEHKVRDVATKSRLHGGYKLQDQNATGQQWRRRGHDRIDLGEDWQTLQADIAAMANGESRPGTDGAALTDGLPWHRQPLSVIDDEVCTGENQGRVLMQGIACRANWRGYS